MRTTLGIDAVPPTSEERELAKCTFRPAINARSHSSPNKSPAARRFNWPPTSEDQELAKHCTFKPKTNSPSLKRWPSSPLSSAVSASPLKEGPASVTRFAPPRVYLAGPEVFLAREKALAIADKKKAILAELNLEGVFPFDLEPGVVGTGTDFAIAIARKDEHLVEVCDAVIANVTPFRGPSADVGTVFEVGYARGLGKPVFGYSNDPRPYSERCGPLSSDGCDADGLHVENFGCFDNLMLHGAFFETQGTTLAAPTPGASDRASTLAHLSAFRAAAARVAEHFGMSERAWPAE